MGEVKYAENALEMFNNKFGECKWIKVVRDNKGRANVSFTIQSAPVGEVGINGVQVSGMLEYVKYLFENLNSQFPCRENSLTITKIEEALHWQTARTEDRINRKVEGKNEA